MEYYWIAGFLILIAGIFFRRWIGRRKYENKEEEMVKKGKIPKGNLGFPVIGETLAFIASGYSSRPVSFMDKRKSLYGKVFKTNIIGTPIIISTDAEVNKVVLQNHGNTFVPAYPKSITKLLGDNSILSINGSHQRRLHALIGSFLRSPHLKERITRDIEVSVDLVLTSWTHLPLVLVQDEIKKMTFEILVKVLMSKSRGNDLDILKLEFEEFIKGLICIPINFPGTTLYKSLKAKERLINVVKKVVEERMKSPAATPSNDAVDVLLKDVDDGGGSVKQSEPLDYVSGKIIEMMIPGEETMPTAMTLAVKFLSDNPVALAKLVEENMEMKRRKMESGEVYNWTDYMSLSFTQNVINETLRMANIINGVWRKALKDIEIKGYIIPKGWCVLASFISVHMDEDIYDNPYQFDPWRWDRMNGSSAGGNISLWYTPFGGGQRLCPGLELSKLEMSIFLHHLVTRYKWTAEKDEIISFPTVKMKRKLPIRVVPVHL